MIRADAVLIAMLRQAVIPLILVLAGFFFVNCLIHPTLSRPIGLYAEGRSEKLVVLDRYVSRTNVAIFGTSHLQNGFDPRAFDARLAADGNHAQSLNLAIAGGSQTEQRAMALEFLRKAAESPTAPKRRLILLEINAGANFRVQHLVHPRAINIYDVASVKLVAALSDSGVGRERQAGRIGYALLASCFHYANLGMLANLVFQPALNAELLQSISGEDRRGLEALEPSSNSSAVIDNIFAQRPVSAQDHVESISAGNRDLVDQVYAAAGGDSVRVAYVVTPLLSGLATAPLYPSEVVTDRFRAPIINMARINDDPELFSKDLWHDTAHLNARGAALFSQVLAAKLAARINLDWLDAPEKP